ncbi:MAG: ABC transporter permease [Clostridia bacterium]|nr:ABC transporter permease [Bacillota bacterium]MBO2521704.1 ABC transporter permease [Bacillota bacterium]
MSYLLDNWNQVAALAGQHLVIVLVAMGLSTAFGVPLGILAARIKSLGPWILGTFGIFYLIPSLALFAILVPFTGLGLEPAIIGLVLYSQLPIVRNTATGLLNVDPALIEAARGMGMTRAQRLFMVELPVALPAIVAGLRVAAVMSVGVATIAAYVGAGGLGNLILRGMQLLYPEMVVAGALPAAVMAVAVDLAFVALERLARRRVAAGGREGAAPQAENLAAV